MKRLFVFALMILLSCATAYARPTKTQYKVKVKMSSGVFKARAGDSLKLTLKEDLIKVVGKTCPRDVRYSTRRYLECPVQEVIVSAQFPPSAISAVVYGQAANFIGVIWTLDGKKASLAVEPSLFGNDFSSIVGLLEKVTGKRSVDADTRVTDHPRVLLGANSHGTNLAAYRDQSMEMARDFKEVCPIVQVTINDQKADFTLILSHIEVGLGRDNQVEVYNKDGDLISGNESGSIMDEVKSACALITTSWAANRE